MGVARRKEGESRLNTNYMNYIDANFKLKAVIFRQMRQNCGHTRTVRMRVGVEIGRQILITCLDIPETII